MNALRPHKKQIEALRDSMAIAYVLLRSYDAVIDDLRVPNRGTRMTADAIGLLTARRNQLHADIGKLRDEMDALEARS